MPLAALIFFLLMVRHRGRGYRWRLRKRTAFDIPADLPPGEVAYLWDATTVDTNGFAATLLDLSRRGIVVMEPTGVADEDRNVPDYRLVVEHARAGRANWFEAPIVAAISEFPGRGEELTLNGLKSLSREWPEEMQRVLREFRDDIERLGRRDGLEELYRGGAAFQVRLAGVVAAASSVAAAVIAGQPLFVIGAAIGVLIVVFAGRMMWRPSRRGVELYRGYQAVRTLLDVSGGMREAPPGAVVVWEEYLVLGVALGVAHDTAHVLHILQPEPLDAMTEALM